MKQEGQVRNRESFLKHIAEKLGKGDGRKHVTLPDWELKPQYKILKDASKDNLVLIFREAAKKVNINVIESSVNDLAKNVQNVLVATGERSITTWDDQRFDYYKLRPVLDEYETHTWDPRLGKENITNALKAGIGITFSDYTLAESATVVLTTSPEKGRSVSLLPENYIALVPRSTIVPRLTQVADIIHENYQKDQEISSCIKFISGPSNSADIELSFVEGVHGPLSATYIIIND